MRNGSYCAHPVSLVAFRGHPGTVSDVDPVVPPQPWWSERASKRMVRSVYSALAIVLLVVGVSMLQGDSNHGVIRPGPVVRLTDAISGTAAGSTSADPGWFAFTTVEVDEMTLLEYLIRRITGDDQVVSLTAPSRSTAARAQMLDSKHTALRIALTETTDVEIPSDGSLVIDVIDGSPAQDAGIRPLDVIVSVDGVKVLDPIGLRTAIGSSTTSMTIVYRRDAAVRTVEATPRDAMLGVRVAPSYAIALAGLADIDTGSVGGPSAGLMMTLAAIDAFSPGDLTAGLRLAGTGTITFDGSVGPVSGVAHKLTAAGAARADWFFVPSSQIDELSGHPEIATVRLVEVATLTDAIAALCASGASDAYCDR